MKQFAVATVAAALSVSGALADETPQNAVAVQGEAEIQLPPDYAELELGVVTQGPVVGDALNDNNARMSRVVQAIEALGIAERDIRTSDFAIQPKYEKLPQGEYDIEDFRSIVGYAVANKVTVTVRNLPLVARIIDESVKAGANASSRVSFEVDHLTAHLDDARRQAVESAHHKAEVLSEAAQVKLGRAISITDNQADTSYNGRPQRFAIETIVVSASRFPTPIEPGLVTIHSAVTVVYDTMR